MLGYTTSAVRSSRSQCHHRAFSFSANVILSEAKNLKSLIRDLVRVPEKSDVGKNFRFFALLRMTEKYGMTR